MVNIFLGGGGDENDSKLLDEFFINKMVKHKKMLYIPIAMDGKKLSYKSCLEWIQSVFGRIGFTNIDMLTQLEQGVAIDSNEFASVYIGGGNTFDLLHKIRSSSFDKIISHSLQNGISIYGGSAGAIILGKNILTCKHMDPNNIGITQFQGLNLINGYSIWCHYNQSDDDLILEFIKDHDCPVIAIPEKSGVYYDGVYLRVIGIEPITLFTSYDKKEICNDIVKI